MRQVGEAIAAALDVTAVSVSQEDATSTMGPFLVNFLTAENRASSAKAVKNLGWQPCEPGLLEDFATGSYLRAAQEMRNGKFLM